MFINHYEMLGMNASGLNEHKVAYTNDDIRRAYRKQALKHHPDHNPHLPEKSLYFNELNKSYEVLSDPLKRAEFDKQLQENPGAYSHSEHLFFETAEMKDDMDENEVKCDDPHAMVVRKTRGIDLTRLVSDADYNTEEIVEIAAQNIHFAYAILDNSSMFNALTACQQFELLFLIDQQGGNANSAFEKATVKEVFKKLSISDDRYITGLIEAHNKQATVAKKYVEKFSDKLLGLSFESLLQLTPFYFPCVVLLLKNYSNLIKPSELDYIVQQHPERKNEILSIYNAHARQEESKKFAIYEKLSAEIKKNGASALYENSNDIPALGIEALSLAEFLPDDEKTSISGDIFFRYFILKNLLIWLPNRITNDKDRRIFQLIVIEHLLNKSSVAKLLYKKNKDKFLSIEISNEEFILLKDISSNLFLTLLAGIHLKIFEDSICAQFNNFALEYTVPEEKEPFLLQRINMQDGEALQFLSRNYLALEAVLSNSLYLEGLAHNKDAQKRVAVIAAKFKFYSNTESLANMPADFQIAYFAAAELYSHINANKPSDLTLEQFQSLLEKATFFNHLLSLQATVFEVRMEIVKIALERMAIDDSLQDTLLIDKFLAVLLNCSLEDRPLLITLLHTSGLSKILINNLLSDLSLKHKLSGKVLHTLSILINDKKWAEQDFSGYRIAKLNSHLTKQKFYTDQDNSHCQEITRSLFYRARLKAYGELTQELADLEDETTLSDNNDALLERIFILILRTGFDQELLTVLQKKIQKHTSLFYATLTLITEKLSLDNELLKAIGYTHVNLKLDKAAELTYFTLAELYLKKYRGTSDGKMVLQLYQTYGERILPLFTTYGVAFKLAHAERLAKILGQVKEGNHHIKFSNNKIDFSQRINQLIDDFKKLFPKCNPTHVKEYYAELMTAINKDVLESSLLNDIVKAYPQDSTTHPYVWLIRLMLLKNSQLEEFTRHHLTFRHLKNHDDADIQTLLLKEVFIVDKTLTNEEINERLTLYFDEQDRDSIMMSLLNISPLNCLTPTLVQFIGHYFNNRNLLNAPLETPLAIKNRTHLVVNLLTTECKSDSKELSNLHNPSIQPYIDKNGLTLLSARKLMVLTENSVPLFPLCDQNLFSVEEISAFDKDSVEYEVYQHTPVNKFSAVNLFLKSDYYIFLNQHLFAPIQSDIKRLEQDGGHDKAQQFKSALVEMKGLVKDTLLSYTEGSTPEQCNKVVNSKLYEKMNEIADRPKIASHRNKIKASLKSLSGVLLALPFGLLPLLSKEYRQRFFKPATAKTLNNAIADLKEKDDVLGLKVRRQYRGSFSSSN